MNIRKKPNSFYDKDYVSIDQISSIKQIRKLFKVADEMAQLIKNHKVYHPLAGKSIAILFYQPSTRTFSSFLAAATRLGAYVTPIHGMQQYSSVSKGETLQDTIRSIYQTTAADAIVLRHPDNNSSLIASKVVPIPLINAGSGKLEHPTQALLDLYTIYNHHKKMNNLHIVMVGDLLYGRTIKSLAKLLALTSTKSKRNKLTLVSPPELKIPPQLISELSNKLEIEETDNLDSCLVSADVIYITRVQKEWFEKAGKLDDYERMKNQFILTRHMTSKMPKKAIVMHPLPRVGEILTEVDNDPRAHYFEQMRSGLYVRMALLKSILIKK